MPDAMEMEYAVEYFANTSRKFRFPHALVSFDAIRCEGSPIGLEMFDQFFSNVGHRFLLAMIDRTDMPLDGAVLNADVAKRRC